MNFDSHVGAHNQSLKADPGSAAIAFPSIGPDAAAAERDRNG
jgi:hypothetical protein